MRTEKFKIGAIVIAFAFALAACDIPDSTEKATTEIDRAAERTGDKLDDASKKLSEQMDKANEIFNNAAITRNMKAAATAEPERNVLDIECGYGGRRAYPRWHCRIASQ